MRISRIRKGKKNNKIVAFDETYEMNTTASKVPHKELTKRIKRAHEIKERLHKTYYSHGVAIKNHLWMRLWDQEEK